MKATLRVKWMLRLNRSMKCLCGLWVVRKPIVREQVETMATVAEAWGALQN
jgi:hypothetical protein